MTYAPNNKKESKLLSLVFFFFSDSRVVGWWSATEIYLAVSVIWRMEGGSRAVVTFYLIFFLFLFITSEEA